MATGQNILCEYCGRVYKEPAAGVIDCPACGGWETYPPRRTEEFELTP